ncbi:ABC transporter substrate-binding protein [Pseudactinotalea sp.]|uniref:ABC transporter substrate-binding protein n=1 Tax=Pseudactinotalea sp. TaxID=1926260 RepID=UPI003B3BE546
MKQYKTKATLVAAAAATALLLGACGGGGGGGGNGGEGNGGEAEPTALGFFTDKAAWEPQFDVMNEASEGADQSTLSFTGYSDSAAYDAFIKQAFRTNDKPDIFTWHTGGQLEELVEAGLVAETTDLWAEAEANGDVPEGLIENYTYDGKQYCVPLNVVYWVMYYNKQVYADNGLEVPATWDELMSNAQTLVDNGVVPFHQMNFIFEFVWFQTVVAGSDPDAYVGLQDGSVSYTDPAIVEAMDVWHQMQTDGYFIDPGVTTDPQTLLQTGEVAMANFGTFFTGQLNALGMVPDEDYGIFAIPNVNPDLESQQAIVETGPLCVGAGSANEQAALDYSAWWMGVDAQNAWTEAFGDVSFNPNVESPDPALSAVVGQVTGPDFQIQKRWLEATPVPIYTVASEEFGAFVTNNGDPMVHLEAIQAAADAYWADQ